MKNIYKIVSISLVILFISSCNKDNYEKNSKDDSLYYRSSSQKRVVNFSTSIINNKITQMDLTNHTDHSLLINNLEFCEANDIEEFGVCNKSNIDKFSESYGKEIKFTLFSGSYTLYNPKFIIFNNVNNLTNIDAQNDFTVTWNVDENNTNPVVISLIQRTDSDGVSYPQKGSIVVTQLTNDDGSFTFTSQQLSQFNSGDIIDLVIIRGNEELFGKDLIGVYNTNMLIAKIQ